MGFFDHLRKTDDDAKKFERVCKIALVGLNWSTLKLFDFFAQKFGSHQAVIIDHRDWNEDHFFYPGPSVDRGESSEILFGHFFPEISLRKGKESLFYKNKKFNQFSGRTKPYPLKEGEAYFRETCCFFEPKLLLDSFKKEMKEAAKQSFQKGEIEQIKQEPSGFRLTLHHSVEVVSEYLFYGHSPREFIRLFQEPKSLSKEFIQFSSQFEKNPSLVVTFESSQKIIPSFQTFFIPQSETHDRGHFIIEAEDVFEEKEGQVIKAHCCMDMNQTGEEDITKKIKRLKRVLKRLYPDFKIEECKEKIYLPEMSPFCSIEESQWVDSLPRFSYFGWSAPLDWNFMQKKKIPINQSTPVYNNARAILSVEQIQSKF